MTNRRAEAWRLAMDFKNAGKPEDQGVFGKESTDYRRLQIADQLIARLQRGVGPDQDSTSLCGPAAFMYCVLRDRPDIYVRYILDLWTTGTGMIGKMTVAPDVDVRKAQTVKISAIDWISLGSLRNVTSGLGAYTSADQDVAAMTFPMFVCTWFKKAFDINPLSQSTSKFGHLDWNDMLSVARLHASGAWALLFIRASMYSKSYGTRGGINPNHWVVLEAPVRINNEPAITLLPSYNRYGCFNPPSTNPIGPFPEAPIQVKAMTWGKVHDLQGYPQTKVKEFLEDYFGALVFPRIS